LLVFTLGLAFGLLGKHVNEGRNELNWTIIQVSYIIKVVRGSTPCRGRVLSLLQHQTGSEALPSFDLEDTEGPSPGFQRPESEADHSLQFPTEVKNTWWLNLAIPQFSWYDASAQGQLKLWYYS
jgi:hypothetical protein